MQNVREPYYSPPVSPKYLSFRSARFVRVLHIKITHIQHLPSTLDQSAVNQFWSIFLDVAGGSFSIDRSVHYLMNTLLGIWHFKSKFCRIRREAPKLLKRKVYFRRLAQSGESFLLSNNHFNATKIEPWPDSSFMISDAQLWPPEGRSCRAYCRFFICWGSYFRCSASSA